MKGKGEKKDLIPNNNYQKQNLVITLVSIVLNIFKKITQLQKYKIKLDYIEMYTKFLIKKTKYSTYANTSNQFRNVMQFQSM